MTIIKLCGQQLKLSAPVIAADTIDYIEMAVDMSEDWQRMDAVYVRFELDNYYVEAQVRDGKIRKEQHLNLTRGSWRVSAYGVRSSGEDIIERITSTTASLDVKVTGAHGGEPLPPDSQGVIERLKAQIAGKLDKKLDAEDAGKVLGIGEDGRVVPVEGGGGEAPTDLILVGKTPAASTHLLVNDEYVEIVVPEMSDIPEAVTEQTVTEWGFTKNTGTYDKPVDGIPESDLSAAVRAKLNTGGGSDVTKDTVKEWGFTEDADLAAVAKSGSYNDLSNKPSIPAAVTESTVSGWGFTKFDGSYSSLSGKPTIPAAVTDQHIIDVINAAYPNAEGVGF